jgi:hypothetical protein
VVSELEQDESPTLDDRVAAWSEFGLRAVAGIVFVAVLLSAVYCLGWLGAESSYQFVVVGGSSSEGTRLGLAFAALVGVLSVGAGMLALFPLRSGRYALPVWVVQLLVVVLSLYSFVLFFLYSLGGLGGPPSDTSAAREFARALRGWFPQIPIVGVIAATEGAVILRAIRSGRAVSIWRLPLVVGGVVTAIVLLLVWAAAATRA